MGKLKRIQKLNAKRLSVLDGKPLSFWIISLLLANSNPPLCILQSIMHSGSEHTCLPLTRKGRQLKKKLLSIAEKLRFVCLPLRGKGDHLWWMSSRFALQTCKILFHKNTSSVTTDINIGCATFPRWGRLTKSLLSATNNVFSKP